MIDTIKKVINDYRAAVRERREELKQERTEQREEFSQWVAEAKVRRELYKREHPIRYQLNRAMAYGLLAGMLAGAGFGVYHLAKTAEEDRFLREATTFRYKDIEYVNPDEERCRTRGMLECIVKSNPDF